MLVDLTVKSIISGHAHVYLNLRFCRLCIAMLLSSWTIILLVILLKHFNSTTLLWEIHYFNLCVFIILCQFCRVLIWSSLVFTKEVLFTEGISERKRVTDQFVVAFPASHSYCLPLHNILWNTPCLLKYDIK